MFVNKRITEFGTHAHASHGSLIPEYDCIELCENVPLQSMD